MFKLTKRLRCTKQTDTDQEYSVDVLGHWTLRIGKVMVRPVGIELVLLRSRRCPTA